MLLESLKESEDLAVSLNTDSQLGSKGIDSTGSKLDGEYAPFTVAFKKQFGGAGFGKVTNHITLFGEGDFHGDFFLDAKKFPAKLDSKDSKRNQLASEWGENIFGLTNESLNELTETEVKPRFAGKWGKGVRKAFSQL